MPPAARTSSRFTDRATAICTPPRMNPCNTTWPAAGRTNCGMSDRYITAIFGFSRFVTKPMTNSRRGASGRCGIGTRVKTGRPPGRSARTASQPRYAAPASFTARYSAGTATKTAASPRFVADRYTANPAATPASEMTPARRPCVMLRDTRYIVFGPGVSTSASATANTPRTADALTMTRSSHGSGVRRTGQSRAGGYTATQRPAGPRRRLAVLSGRTNRSLVWRNRRIAECHRRPDTSGF